MESLQISLPDAEATQALAQRMAPLLVGGAVIWLQGELGAGKSTFARALLQALGVGERIKSPTYSLIENYALRAGNSAWHLDLYRIAAAEELDYLGLEALREPGALVLVEWSEHGARALPPADLHLHLSHVGEARAALLSARSARAHAWLQVLARITKTRR
ncbi:MAG: tRNA (adenosine(37)-N6)-threonylcarbamoyltransferase complex ATPase subunit type 1 TsaE [Metallibacterium sp.]